MISKDDPLDKVLELAPACSCPECNHGCKMGSGSLIEGDAEKIAKFLGMPLKEFKKKYLVKLRMLNKEILKPKIDRFKGKPYGPCVFFKKNKCSIHPVKPLECKIAMGCRPYGEEMTLWFMLNYVLDVNDDESIREYASYLKSGGKTILGGQLEEIVPDKKRLKKILENDKPKI